MTPDARIVSTLRSAGCVFAEEEASLLASAAPDADTLEALLARRVAGEPLEHVLGRVSFAGTDLVVGPGVFVPRQRTALLVEVAARLLAGSAEPELLDLCCGCGAIAAAVAHVVPHVRLTAADVDPASIACARTNLAGLPATVLVSDLYAALPDDLRGQVDVVAANVPYVPTSAVASLPPEARDHEPLVALDGGTDGLDVARRVAEQAPRWLAPGGSLLIEVGSDQVEAARALMRETGLTPTVHRDGERGATVVAGRHGVASSPEASA